MSVPCATSPRASRLSGAKTCVVAAASSAAVGGAAEHRMRAQPATLSLAGLVHDEMRRADSASRAAWGSSATSSARLRARATCWASAPWSSRDMPPSSTARAVRSASPTWTSFARTTASEHRPRARGGGRAPRRRGAAGLARGDAPAGARERTVRAREREGARRRGTGAGWARLAPVPAGAERAAPPCNGGGDRAGARRHAASVHRGGGGVRRLAGAQRRRGDGSGGARRRRSEAGRATLTDQLRRDAVAVVAVERSVSVA